MSNRKSGILLHISSLPSPYGIGDFGPEAYKFADFLFNTKQGAWQVLPFSPTDPVFGNCPYNSISACACNTLFISPDLLAKEGYINKKDLASKPEFPKNKCDYSNAGLYKQKLFEAAYQKFKSRKINHDGFEKFCFENSYWLDDFSLFVFIKRNYKGKIWYEWPDSLKSRDKNVLSNITYEYKGELEKEKFLQYIFFRQWISLRNYCNNRNIKLIGDVPIYVCYDSVDVWKNHELFNLDESQKPVTVAGVPPDYFSATGQLWGNPVFRWDVLKNTNYKWWIDRIAHNLKLFDKIRIDHFRGFEGYWEVPAGETTAINGRWVKAEGADFFRVITEKFSDRPFIAEDLGVITDDVREVMKQFNLPGMRVLLFAFGDDNQDNPYLPRNFIENCVVYTGTHDNNTVKGWFKNEACQKEKERLFHYLGHKAGLKNVHLEFIRLAMESIADTVIFPMQDILGLGSESRMNKPSTTKGNWEWRLSPEQITKDIAGRLLKMTEICGRGKS
ncbi:MAG: 4-alpha-glucanotransferase [bacterium]